YFSLAVERKVTRRQGGTPTMKVTPSACKRRLTNNRCGICITTQSVGTM
ncbi:MAG: hypothetical protein ACJAT7_003662, partial [Psychromonas sp.]